MHKKENKHESQIGHFCDIIHYIGIYYNRLNANSSLCFV